jgi:hypothetical protein
MKENLFVIFAPGLGGNHLSNLLSITHRFHRHCNFDLYKNGMINAHITPLSNLDQSKILQHQTALADNNNILCGHIAEYIWLKNNGFDLLFPNRKFVTIGFPKIGTVAYQRLVNLKSYYLDQYLFWEQSTLYSQQCMELLFDEHDFFHIGSDDIFTKSVNGVVRFITDQLCTTVDPVQAQQLHTIWFENITG